MHASVAGLIRPVGVCGGSQINLDTTPGFEQHLATLMRPKGLPSKSEAIRMAVAAQAKAAERASLRRDFKQRTGLVVDERPGRLPAAQARRAFIADPTLAAAIATSRELTRAARSS